MCRRRILQTASTPALVMLWTRPSSRFRCASSSAVSSRSAYATAPISPAIAVTTRTVSSSAPGRCWRIAAYSWPAPCGASADEERSHRPNMGLREPVLLHAVDQCAARDAEAPRGLALVAARFGQRIDDASPLHVGEPRIEHGATLGEAIAFAADRRWQMIDRDPAVLCEHDRVLDGIAEFAHVARPR